MKKPHGLFPFLLSLYIDWNFYLSAEKHLLFHFLLLNIQKLIKEMKRTVQVYLGARNGFKYAQNICSFELSCIVDFTPMGKT